VPIPNDATHKHYGKGQTEDTIIWNQVITLSSSTLPIAAHMQFIRCWCREDYDSR